MKKMVKKTTALALTSAMILGMNAFAFADDTAIDTNSNYTISGDKITEDISSINFIKNYIRGAETLETSVSPAEVFKFTITPYAVWNAGSSTGEADGDAYDVTNMPLFTETATDGKVVVDKTNRKNVISISEVEGAAGSADVVQEITLNTYKSVGDFWYKVVEDNNKTTGVLYGTNDSKTEDITKENGDHDATYYIHVQVVNNPNYDSNDNSKKFLRSVTLHTTAPASNITNVEYNIWAEGKAADGENQAVEGNYFIKAKKVQNIQNKYYAGSLTISKVVEGNAGDHDKLFPVVVTFTKAADTIINSDITYTGAYASIDAISPSNAIIVGQSGTNTDWKAKFATEDTEIAGFDTKYNATDGELAEQTDLAYAQKVIYVKADTTVVFKNIPYGVTYTVKELKPSDNSYTNKLKFEDEDPATTFDNISLAKDTGVNDFSDFGTATGSISDEADVITITNKKETKIDIGVILSSTPYLALLAATAGVGIVASKRRKDLFEE